jgi:hypothetical protein
MYYYLDIAGQITNIMKKFKICDLIHRSDPSILCDFCDGDFYKEILDGEDGTDIKAQKAFNMLGNSDGIKIGDGTKLSAWPIMINLLELPLESRFSIDNTILAGWY